MGLPLGHLAEAVESDGQLLDPHARDDVGHGLRLVARQKTVADAGGDRAQQRRDPEEPQLGEGPPADDHRRAGAARGIHRCVGHGDADEVKAWKRNLRSSVPTSGSRGQLRAKVP